MGLYLVQALPERVTRCGVLRESHAGDVFELARQVGDTRIPHLVGNLGKGEASLADEFFHIFDFLGDVVFLYRASFEAREYAACVVVAHAELVGETCR